jgi:hypothetical protein
MMTRGDEQPDASMAWAVLRLWAAAMAIQQGFSQVEIESVPGLVAVIEAAGALPEAIGWGDKDLHAAGARSGLT